MENEPVQIVDDAAAANAEANPEGEEPRPSQHLGQQRQSEIAAQQKQKPPVKPVYKYTYGKWREDKEADTGFSKELISLDSEKISDQTTLDSLEIFPFQNEKAGKVGIQTLH